MKKQTIPENEWKFDVCDRRLFGIFFVGLSIEHVVGTYGKF